MGLHPDICEYRWNLPQLNPDLIFQPQSQGREGTSFLDSQNLSSTAYSFQNMLGFTNRRDRNQSDWYQVVYILFHPSPTPIGLLFMTHTCHTRLVCVVSKFFVQTEIVPDKEISFEFLSHPNLACHLVHQHPSSQTPSTPTNID